MASQITSLHCPNAQYADMLVVDNVGGSAPPFNVLGKIRWMLQPGTTCKCSKIHVAQYSGVLTDQDKPGILGALTMRDNTVVLGEWRDDKFYSVRRIFFPDGSTAFELPPEKHYDVHKIPSRNNVQSLERLVRWLPRLNVSYLGGVNLNGEPHGFGMCTFSDRVELGYWRNGLCYHAVRFDKE